MMMMMMIMTWYENWRLKKRKKQQLNNKNKRNVRSGAKYFKNQINFWSVWAPRIFYSYSSFLGNSYCQTNPVDRTRPIWWTMHLFTLKPSHWMFLLMMACYFSFFSPTRSFRTVKKCRPFEHRTSHGQKLYLIHCKIRMLHSVVAIAHKADEEDGFVRSDACGEHAQPFVQMDIYLWHLWRWWGNSPSLGWIIALA